MSIHQEVAGRVLVVTIDNPEVNALRNSYQSAFSHYLAGFVIALSLIAVVYIGLVALVQADMKKLIAYSSIAHMGFVTLGFFMFNGRELIPIAVEGALIQMISHGFVSAALFLCVGVMYDRMHSRQIADYGGVVNTMPKFAAFMMLFALANAGLPGTSGFVGEFMVIMGAVEYSFWIAFAAATTLIFGAAYTLWMYKRVIFGDVANRHVAELVDINRREFIVLVLLAVAVLGMGVYPKPFSEVMDATVARAPSAKSSAPAFSIKASKPRPNMDLRFGQSACSTISSVGEG